MVPLRTRMAMPMLLCMLVFLGSCRPRNLPPELGEVEWLIVDCHDDGIVRAWISKLSPQDDAGLIEEFIASVRAAKWRGPSKSGDYAFLVFKLKRGGIKAFNFVAWGGDAPELEIRPGYWSRTMPKILDRIRDEKVGWRRGDSLPLARIVEIQVWQYGNLVTGFLAHQREFAPLTSAATEVLKRVDPRACTFGGEQADPRYAAEHQPEPQFIVFFEKPLELYKLIPYFRKGEGTVYVKYRTFRSSVAALCLQYVAFLPDATSRRKPSKSSWRHERTAFDERDNTWYAWDTSELRACFEHMGRPDPQEAFQNLLRVYKETAEPKD
jgi:hypothetical protein